MNKWVLTSGLRKEQATVRSSHSFLPLALLHICPSKCAKHICPPHPTPSLLNQMILRFLCVCVCVCVCDKHLEGLLKCRLLGPTPETVGRGPRIHICNKSPDNVDAALKMTLGPLLCR